MINDFYCGVNIAAAGARSRVQTNKFGDDLQMSLRNLAVENGHDIAIVGMACRFAGARNINEYWSLLKNPKPQFAAVPDSRWRHGSFLSEDPRDSHSAYSDQMATLADVDAFDARHYKIPPQRARAMDPQHRLLVDLTREAIQDAGWEANGFDRANTSVIMGLSESGYRDISATNVRLRQLAGGEFGRPLADATWKQAGCAVGRLHGTALPGVLLNFGPGSISSVFDLHGESYAIDAACSGGLVAVAEAVYALRTGRCRVALAGGAQLVLTPDLFVGLSRIGAISPTGACRPFDTRADGLVLGEGAGILVLRPLAEALAAGDRVYAIIRGVGLSNDGTVQGGMTPQAGGQLMALRRAYADAGVRAGAVGYLEAHGTATAVGDQVEISALRALRQDHASPTYLGAAKAVIGHTLAASGIAGLIKSVLVVHKRQIVPQPDFDAANDLAVDAAGLRIPTELTEWAESGSAPRRAGVSAFGFGGTNVHVVLEEASQTALRPSTSPPSGPELLLLTARDREGLAKSVREIAGTVAEEQLTLEAVAGTLARRELLPARLAIVAATVADAIGKLAAASLLLESGRTGELAPGVLTGTASAVKDHADRYTVDALSTSERAAALGDLATRAAAGADVRSAIPSTILCTLPPSPLSPRKYWIVDEGKRQGGVGHRVPSSSTPDGQPAARQASQPMTSPSDADILEPPDAASIVLEEIARISALPEAELHENLRLAADLGFDSLMLHELEVSIESRFSGVALDLTAQDQAIGELVSTVCPAWSHRAPQVGSVTLDDQTSTWEASTARMGDFPEVRALDTRFQELESSGLPNPYFRVHEGNICNTTSIGDRQYISFSSYNYLGLSGHPVVNQAVRAAVERYGSSVSGSRVLAGERPLTQQLERALSGLLGTEDCLALVSGHATNVTAIGHIAGAEDLIVHDALAHDSILQGCALSSARRRPFPHNDLGQLEYILKQTRARFRRVLVVVEGVYSMDGDLVDLPRLVELKKRYGALLMIDEAHSIGTVGDRGGGVGEFFGVDRCDVDLWMGTLSKSLASCGGYLAGSARTIRWLKYTLPGFVYSVGLTPANAAAALAAIELIRSESHRLQDLRKNSEQFLAQAKAVGIATGSSGNSPIVPCIVGDSAKTLRLASSLFDRGIVVDPILYPAVDEREARLRFFLTSEHEEHQIRRAITALASELELLHG